MPKVLTADDIANLRNQAIPRYVTLAALTWVIQDYFITVEDEATGYIFLVTETKLRCIHLLLWMRYYTVLLLLLDTLGFFVYPGPKTVTANAVLSAISLWSVEVIMQFRIYLLFDRSKRVAFVNGALFAISIAIFIWMKIDNALYALGHRPKRGACSTGDTRWAQWPPGTYILPTILVLAMILVNNIHNPATLFELVLFGMAMYKAVVSYAEKVKLNGRQPLSAILLHGNIMYFFV
ncbi:hypothetical protein M413DRAFT_26634 [Hebeloma cylindrosporum]|uniref:Uncharacterized protein n=1 Tax=Hebeloma cylindrosporum TaxID=76867 RepID=A0A0C3CEJ8_HEBCY|nr:hypothetical protein M413DRAFT_26634 [Hebeloma cylindrosporum h7]